MFGDKRDVLLAEIAQALGISISVLKLESTFLENGGDSLAYIKLHTTLGRLGIKFSTDLMFSGRTVSELVSDIILQSTTLSQGLESKEACYGQKRSLPWVDNGQVKRSRKSSCMVSTLQYTTPHHHRMTEMQLAFIHSSQNHPGRNFIQYYETYHPNAVPALREAWKAVIEIEPIFRTAFELTEKGGYLIENSRARFHWEHIEVFDKTSYDEKLERTSLNRGLVETSFKVITLRSCADQAAKSTIIWGVHHALIDAYSCGIVLSKVRRVVDGEVLHPGPSFAQFTAKLHALQELSFEDGKSYWELQHKTYTAATSQLSLAPPLPDMERSNDRLVGLISFQTDARKLSKYCQQAGVTTAALFHAAWGATLTKYMESNQVCFGTVFSGRSIPIEGIENTVGPTINTLPLNISLKPETTSTEYVKGVFSQMLELSKHQSTASKQGFTRNFSTAINIEIELPSTAGTESALLDTPYTRVVSDIPLQVDVGKSGIVLFKYHLDRYSKFQIEHLAEAFSTCLEVLQQPYLNMGTLLTQIISNKSRQKLSDIGNWLSPKTRISSVQDDLVTLFSRAAFENASLTAVELAGNALNYWDLHVQSSIVAKRIAQKVSPGDVVCVHADRTLGWIIAIYAVLKAGAIYCPLDETLPTGIRNQYFETSQATLYLSGSILANGWHPTSAKFCLSVAELLSDAPVDYRNSELLAPNARPDANAYLCFTSGSTGIPKGVLCKHQGLVAFQRDLKVRLHARPGWKIAQFMSPGFDGSIHEIFSALSYGATLLLSNRSEPFAHLKAADAAILTPSVAGSLDVDAFPNLSTVYLVGEIVPQLVCNTWASKKKLYNMYGPTEATCGATIKRLNSEAPITLGVPNQSTRIYILDSNQELVPPGVIGTIYLAGLQAESEYIGRPEETARKFFADSVNPQFEEKMHHTGDRGYWDENGELMFLGRIDRQIKLRGFRIDLDDLEARVLRVGKYCSAVAVALKDDHLVAQAQPSDIDMDAFRAQISEHIPAYSLPRYIVAVKEFPVTPAGKLDYRAISNRNYSTPADQLQASSPVLSISQQMVTSALMDVLGNCKERPIDIDANFGDLGASSIIQLLLSHCLSKRLNQPIPVELIMKSATVRELAASIDSLEEMVDIAETNTLGECGISPVELSWWEKYQYKGGSSSFNVTFVCQRRKETESARLVRAWNVILARHRILSCRYSFSQQLGIIKTYSNTPPTVLEVRDLDVNTEINTPFDLQKDDLIRVTISAAHLVVVVSHIICDFTTLKSMLQEVAIVYHEGNLSAVKKSFSQTQWSIPSTPCNQSFWRDYLNDTPRTRFSIGRNQVRNGWEGSSSTIEIPKNTLHEMIQFTASEKVTMHQLALAAMALALQHHNESCDITLGAPYYNRHSRDDENVVGLFLEPLPIRIRYPQAETAARNENTNYPLELRETTSSFIQTVRQSSRAALSHAIPWDQLLSQLNVTRTVPDSPIFDAMVSFHEADQALRPGIPGLEVLPTWTDGAKFKLMAEFSAVPDGSLWLRLEYSIECFDTNEIKCLHKLIVTALEGLITRLQYSKVKEVLRLLNPALPTPESR